MRQSPAVSEHQRGCACSWGCSQGRAGWMAPSGVPTSSFEKWAAPPSAERTVSKVFLPDQVIHWLSEKEPCAQKQKKFLKRLVAYLVTSSQRNPKQMLTNLPPPLAADARQLLLSTEHIKFFLFIFNFSRIHHH